MLVAKWTNTVEQTSALNPTEKYLQYIHPTVHSFVKDWTNNLQSSSHHLQYYYYVPTFAKHIEIQQRALKN